MTGLLAGEPASFEPTAVRRSALGSATAVRAVDPSLGTELQSRIDTLERTRRPATAADWETVLGPARRALVDAAIRHTDEAARWAGFEAALTGQMARLEELDQPWLSENARQAIGHIATLERRARLAAERSRFVEAQAIAEPIEELLAEVERAHADVVERFESHAQRAQWDEAVRQALLASTTGRSVLVVDKWHRRLYLLKSSRVAASWPVDLGRRPLERKLHQGDRATPEGSYRVVMVKDRGASRYYKALLLDYPSPADQQRYRDAVARGEAPETGAGSLIEIHGHGGRGVDWTDGCIAVADPVMDRLLEEVESGSPVTIVGRISEGTLE